MKTQAALLVQTGQPLVLADIETPALKPGQVLVEIAYSGACGTQVMEWRGDKGEDKWVPHCLGHEGTGTVLEAGSAVTKVKAGDKVVLSWIKGSGIEAGGAVYDWDGKKVNAGGVTTFQRHAVVSENRLTLLPPDMPMDVAVLLGCAAPTGMGAVYNVLKVQPGDAVAVFGTGGIGLNALMAAALAGAMPVIGIDPNPTRRALAQLYGATHVIDASGDVLAEIKKIVPQGVDLAVESSGIPGRDGAGDQCHAPAGRPRGGDRQRQAWRSAAAQSRRLQPGQEPARHLGRRQRAGSRLRTLRAASELRPLPGAGPALQAVQPRPGRSGAAGPRRRQGWPSPDRHVAALIVRERDADRDRFRQHDRLL